MQFTPQPPLAGTIRIGSPPSREQRHPSKLSYFEFCGPTRNKAGFYERDDKMHEIMGQQPTRFGPVFLVSDNVLASIRINLGWWGGTRLNKKLYCYKIIDSLGGGVVDDGRPAMRLKKKPDGTEGYEEFECLSDKCPDFMSGKCNKSIQYRFVIPVAERLGEYSLTARSYNAISSGIGLLEILKTRLPYLPDNGSLIGLSKLPLMFELRETTTRFQGKPVPMWYPVPYLESNQGAFHTLSEIAKGEKKLLESSSEKTHTLQLEAAKELLSEETESIDEVSNEPAPSSQKEEDKSLLEASIEKEVEESVSLTQKIEEAIPDAARQEDAPQANQPSDDGAGEDAETGIEPVPEPDKNEQESEQAEVPEPKQSAANITGDFTVYEKVEKGDSSTFSIKKISTLPDGYEQLKTNADEVVEDVYVKANSDVRNDVNIAIGDPEMVKLFAQCQFKDRPMKLYAMLRFKGKETIMDHLRKSV